MGSHFLSSACVNLLILCSSLPVLQVIAPEEIVDPNVDEHSVMTYLSQFPKSKLKPGAPLRAKTLHPKMAKAFGPGEEKNRGPNSKSIQKLVKIINLHQTDEYKLIFQQTKNWYL